MSYLVLARKYRPQTFEEVVGQEHVTRTLASAITQGRVHHAFLLCGARGVGKTTVARILAKCLSCVNAPTAVPCNVCDSCREITSSSSVDVQEIDGASNNGVEDVRTLRENVRYLPVRGKKKVYIIDEVHMLSTAAFNALLKTLEEPPPHAVFIFATTEVHKIPITILSRVQRYDFRLVSMQRIADFLAKVLDDESVAYDRGALDVVAREAGGSVRDALSLLEQVLAVGAAAGEGSALASEQAAADALGVADRGLVRDLGRAILARDAAAALGLIATAVDHNIDVKHLSQVLLEHLRDLVVSRVVKDPHALIEASEQELAALVEAARAVPEGLLPLLFDRCSRLVEEVTESALPRFALEVGLVELCQVEPLEPIGDLLDRLEALEGRLGRGDPGARTAPPPRLAAPAAPAAAAESARRLPSSPPRTTAGAASAPTGPAAQSATASPSVTGSPSGPPSASRSASASASLSGAAAASLSAPAPVAAGARPTTWNELSHAIAERNPRLAAFLGGEEVEFAPPRIVVAFSRPFEAEQAQEKLAEATRQAREILGLPDANIEIRDGRGRSPSANHIEQQQHSDEREHRRREALEHPARRMITSTFGDDVSFKDPDVE